MKKVFCFVHEVHEWHTSWFPRLCQQKFNLARKNYLLTGSLTLLLIIIVAAILILREYSSVKR